MKTCKYCGRYMKNRVMNCLSCGSDDFSKIMDDKIVIVDAPKEGFLVHTEDIERQIKKHKNYTKIGLCTLPFYLLGIIGINYPLAFSIFIFLASQLFFITLALIILGVQGTKNYQLQLKKLNYLKYHGKLVKNQHYKVTNVRDNYCYCTVSFRKSNQDKAIPLKTNKIFATELFYDDGLIDVLIDPEDLNNYYISFDLC